VISGGPYNERLRPGYDTARTSPAKGDGIGGTRAGRHIGGMLAYHPNFNDNVPLASLPSLSSRCPQFTNVKADRIFFCLILTGQRVLFLAYCRSKYNGFTLCPYVWYFKVYTFYGS